MGWCMGRTGRAVPAGAPAARARRSRMHALVDAVAAIRAADPDQVQVALQGLARQRRWLTWLAWAAGTIAVVFDGLVLLVRNWKLTLLQVVPAAWIYVMTWNLKSHFLDGRGVPTEVTPGLAAGVVLVAQLAYWCNATFAFTMLQGRDVDILAAFRQARGHWRLVGGLALLTSAVQAVVWLLMPGVRGFWLALLILFVVQVYLFVAVPSWLLRVARSGTRRERIVRTATTGVLAGVAAVPGFLLNRIGLLMVGTSALWPVGIAVIAVATVLHVTASSGVRVVKMSARLRGATEGDAGGP